MERKKINQAVGHAHDQEHTHGHSVGERLYIHRHSVIHSLPGHIKLLAFLLFMIVVVATPIRQWESFVGYFLVVSLAIYISKLPPLTLFKRSTIEFPFILFAILMPFTAGGEIFQVGPISLSREGSIAGLNLIAKATIGVLCSMILAGSTTAHSLLAGFVRIKTPSLFVQIAAFMIRYLNVINDQMTRMKVARESRGFQARGLRSWPTFSSTLGALFIRSYERGERVHLAMLARGYGGTLSSLATEQVRPQHWRIGMTFPLLGIISFLIGRVVL